MQQITSNVYVETQWVSGSSVLASSNSSFITTSAGIVMIDAPMEPVNALKWRDIMAEKGELLYLVNTEFHSDHTMGNHFFPVPVIAHEETKKWYESVCGPPEDARQKVLDRYPDSGPLVENYKLRSPTITFDENLTLHLGDHTIELIHLPGHTPGQTCVHVPSERIVFPGDNFTNALQPSLSECLPLEWLESVDRLLDLDVDAFVPGHGEVGDKKAVREFATFLGHCVETIGEAIEKGMEKAEAVETIEFEGVLIARHPGRDWQRKNVARLYDMLSTSA